MNLRNILQASTNHGILKPDDTNKLLEEIGYVSTKIHLHNDCVNLIDREIYSRFVKTVIMKPFLEYLPDDDDKLRNRYLELFLQEVEKSRSASISSNKSQTPWSLDYVRLNIIADKL